MNDIPEHEIDSDIIIRRGKSKFLGIYYLIFGIIPIVFFLTKLYRNVDLEKNDFIMFYPVEESHPLPLTISFDDLQEVEVSYCAIETLVFPVATQEEIT